MSFDDIVESEKNREENQRELRRLIENRHSGLKETIANMDVKIYEPPMVSGNKIKKRKHVDEEKKRDLAATKGNIPSAYEDPDEDQQKAIDELDKQTGFNVNPVPLVEAASEAIMAKYNFLTVEETEQIWYYDKGACVQWLDKNRRFTS